MPAIFVCYRREDSAGHAGRLFDRLQEHFGRGNVFWDVSGSIEPGEPFGMAIGRALGSCDALLAVIGEQWLMGTDAAGRRRLEAPDDYVRLEIATALQRGIRVIPVLVQHAAMPRAEDLPQVLQPLAQYQAVELSDNRWDFDVAQLIGSLEKALGPPRAPGTARWMKAAGTIAAVTGLVVALNQVGFFTDGDRQPSATHPIDPGVEQEPNDHVSKANWIELGKEYKGALKRDRDAVDYFAFATGRVDTEYVRVLVRVLDWGGNFGNFGVEATLLDYDTEEELGRELAIYGSNLSHAFEVLPDRKYFLRLSLFEWYSDRCTYELRLTPEEEE